MHMTLPWSVTMTFEAMGNRRASIWSGASK